MSTCVCGIKQEETVANLRINGQERAYDGDPSMPLLWYLRDEFGLTGTKFGSWRAPNAAIAPCMSTAWRRAPA
jgi:aerobic-type carbon monoxide dehydrogenase small subunit (CoxS/CutS family)